jgi:hypothetical protein
LRLLTVGLFAILILCATHLLIIHCRLFIILYIVEWFKVLVLAGSCPRSLWHWSINLLQVKLVLNSFLVDIGNHVWWLYERHGEGEPHPDTEATLSLWLRKVHLNWLKVFAESTFDTEWLNYDCILLVFVDLFKVFEIDSQVLIVLLHLAKFLIDHCSYNMKLLYRLCVVTASTCKTV